VPPIPPDYDSHLVGLDRNKVGARLVAARPGTAAEAALVSLLAINGLRISEALGADIGARPRLGSYAGSVKGPAADEHAVHRLTSPSELSLVYQVRLLEMSGTAHQPIGGWLVRPRCRPTVMMRRQGPDDMPNASTSPTIVEDSVRAYPSTGECCAAGTPQCEPLSAPHRSSDRSRGRSFFRNKRYFRLGTVSDDTFVTVRS